MASKTSCRCLSIYSSTINQLFCAVDICYEIFVSKAFTYHEVDFSAEEGFQGIAQIKVVLYIVPFLVIGGVEIHKQVHIAPVIESIGKDRPKDSQGLDLILATKVENPLQINFYQFHRQLCFTRKDNNSF